MGGQIGRKIGRGRVEGEEMEVGGKVMENKMRI